MDALPPDLDSLLTDLRTALNDLYGDRLGQLVLYGSHARGDAHEQSDVDVLVVLEGPVESGREIRRMSKIRTQLGLKHERPISLLPVSEKAYRNPSSGWLRNVHGEGAQI